MSEKNLYTSAQIARAYQLMEVLSGHEFDPLTAKQIRERTGWDGTTTTRQCQAAESAGFVEMTADKRWRLAPKKMTNIAVSVQHGIQRAKSRFEDEATNFTRSMI